MKRKSLIQENNNYNEMPAPKAQVAIEHLTVTAAILAMVTIAFAFGFVTFDQNIKIAKARDALTALVGAANEVYTFGEGNTRFVDVSFPNGLPANYITIVNLCGDGTNLECPATGNEEACNCIANEDINLSAIKLRVGLLGGETAILRESKAKLVLDSFPPENEAAGGPPYPIRVSWTDDGEKIKLQRV
jgi:hypothetical protein